MASSSRGTSPVRSEAIAPIAVMFARSAPRETITVAPVGTAGSIRQPDTSIPASSSARSMK